MCDGEKVSKQKNQMDSHLGRRTGIQLLLMARRCWWRQVLIPTVG